MLAIGLMLAVVTSAQTQPAANNANQNCGNNTCCCNTNPCSNPCAQPQTVKVSVNASDLKAAAQAQADAARNLSDAANALRDASRNQPAQPTMDPDIKAALLRSLTQQPAQAPTMPNVIVPDNGTKDAVMALDRDAKDQSGKLTGIEIGTIGTFAATGFIAVEDGIGVWGNKNSSSNSGGGSPGTGGITFNVTQNGGGATISNAGNSSSTSSATGGTANAAGGSSTAYGGNVANSGNSRLIINKKPPQRCK